MNEQNTVTLLIDEVSVQVPAGTTIMEAAETLGITIPRLCYHPDLSLQGSCRVCLVEVQDIPFYVTACSASVTEGMAVRTNSPEIRQARRDIVELLLDNHPRECQTCERDGHCELQRLAYTLGVRERLFDGTTYVSVHELLGARRPQLLPEREAARQAVDQVDVEGSAADQVCGPHSLSSPS